jgi:myo-inositol-1(or 4)-monophosphatase
MQGSANLNIMIKAARKAGRSLVKDFREVENLQVSSKGRAISSAAPTSPPKRSSRKSFWAPARTTAGWPRKRARSPAPIPPAAGSSIR